MRHTTILAECVSHCSLLKSYVGLMTDFPHIMFELTLTALQDVVLALILWPQIKKALARWRARTTIEVHKEIDREHGVTHAPAADSTTSASTGSAPAAG